MSHAEIRALCQTEAMKWVDVQRSQFRRLGVLGDWDNPYLTLDPRYEAGILDVLADLVEAGLRRPPAQADPLVHDRPHRPGRGRARISRRRRRRASTSTSRWSRACPQRWGEAPARGTPMIWTTTPWTLPANVAIAVHPDLDYAGVRYVDPATGQAVQTILAADLVAEGHGLRRGHRVRRGRPVPRQGARAFGVSPPVHRPGQPDRAGRVRQRRGRHRAGPHRARARCRGLPDRPGLSASRS